VPSAQLASGGSLTIPPSTVPVKLISLFGLHWDIIAEMTGMQLSLFTFSFHGLARARKMRPTGEFEPTDVGCYGTRYG
jgi:hypothetical protein